MDGGGLGGRLNLTPGVRGGSISELSKCRSGEDEISDGVGCLKKERPLVGLMSWEEERILAISSSARPRLILGLSALRSISLELAHCRDADDSREEK